MAEEVMLYLNPQPDGIYVDCTVGDGGHAAAICSRLTGKGFLIGMDRDNESLKRAEEKLSRVSSFAGHYRLFKEEFANIDRAVEEAGYEKVDGILLDLGISSNQVDVGDRGFSFQQDGPLDMRMDDNDKYTAADILKTYSREELTRIFREYGEEKWAARIAAFIIDYRKEKEIITTSQLVSIIQAAVPVGARQKGKHPARRSFQALRIAVNRELEQLRVALPLCLDLLTRGGVICVISYHSLEDRMVKQFLREKSEGCSCPPRLPQCVCGKVPEIELISRKGIKPALDEVRVNSRARSAILRAGKKRQLN